ncbi:pentapeptide repeat-containing protein, partial [Acinetobacter baumannii]
PAMSSAQGFGSNSPRTKLTQSQLNAILLRHQAFRKSQPGGVRANLKMRDLSHLDLSGIDLSDADLSGAKLFSARLTNANLAN